MKVIFQRRMGLWAAILMLVIAVAMPGAALAQGKGNKERNKARQAAKKAEKFKNGQNARDGRWDGRGPRTDRDDRYDDDDDYYDDDDYRNGRRRRTNDRDDNGTNDRTEIRRQAISVGYQEGLRAGESDRASGRGYDLESHNTYRDATAGYNSSYGDINFYRTNFRQGYRQGYEDGYRNQNGSGRRGRLGTILGDILGRP